MDKLEYKGYFGSIEYSKEDNCLYGKVLGMQRNLISYEGNTASELEEDFIGAIDTYLEHCNQKGIKPRKSYNGVLNIRIPAYTHGKIAMISERTGTSINAFIRNAVEKELMLSSV
jgi:predicted HicB family RNase H-like nuclease